MTEDAINIAWLAVYAIFGVLFVILFLIYLSSSYKDFRKPHLETITKASYALFAIALLIRAIGFMSSSAFIKVINNQYLKINCTDNSDSQTQYFLKLQLWSNIPSLVPGYTISASYCFIFFSWCAVCIESLEKKKSAMMSRWRKVLFILLLMITVLCLISVFCFLFLDTESSTKLHILEACFAISRDLLIGTSFVIYLSQMWDILSNPCFPIFAFFHRIFCRNQAHKTPVNRIDYGDEISPPHLSAPQNHDDNSPNDITSSLIQDENHREDATFNAFSASTATVTTTRISYETALVLMCFAIIIALFCRALSIAGYTISWKTSNPDVCKINNAFEYSKGYMALYVFEQIICEVMPVAAILWYRYFIGGKSSHQDDFRQME